MVLFAFNAKELWWRYYNLDVKLLIILSSIVSLRKGLVDQFLWYLLEECFCWSSPEELFRFDDLYGKALRYSHGWWNWISSVCIKRLRVLKVYLHFGVFEYLLLLSGGLVGSEWWWIWSNSFFINSYAFGINSKRLKRALKIKMI